MRLGQSATTLSGGEAQRIKLAKELSRKSTGRTLYLLDEPTTGLHFADVEKLMDVLNRLVDNGNSVVVIEHHLDVIKQADFVIDMGPEGGEKGGEIVVAGTPEEVARHPLSHTGWHWRRCSPADEPRQHIGICGDRGVAFTRGKGISPMRPDQSSERPMSKAAARE